MDKLEYVYLIRHIPSGRFYAGSSYKKDCHPDQLWTTYFTSSSVVKHLIEADGVNSFEVLEIIPRPLNDAREYEALLLKSVNAAKSVKWINKSNGADKFECLEHTDETKCKISLSNKGKPKSEKHKEQLRLVNLGKTHTDATKMKLSELGKGRILGAQSVEHRSNISKSRKGQPGSTLGVKFNKIECQFCGSFISNTNITRHISSKHSKSLS